MSSKSNLDVILAGATALITLFVRHCENVERIADANEVFTSRMESKDRDISSSPEDRGRGSAERDTGRTASSERDTARTATADAPKDKPVRAPRKSKEDKVKGITANEVMEATKALVEKFDKYYDREVVPFLTEVCDHFGVTKVSHVEEADRQHALDVLASFDEGFDKQSDEWKDVLHRNDRREEADSRSSSNSRRDLA